MDLSPRPLLAVTASAVLHGRQSAGGCASNEMIASFPSARFCVTPKIMKKSIKVTPKKKRGRPATGRDPHVTSRMASELIVEVEAWATANDTTRSAAIRRLVELGLEVKTQARRVSSPAGSCAHGNSPQRRSKGDRPQRARRRTSPAQTPAHHGSARIPRRSGRTAEGEGKMTMRLHERIHAMRQPRRRLPLRDRLRSRRRLVGLGLKVKEK